MAITPKFKISAIEAKVKRAVTQINNAMIQALKRLGEQAITIARDSGDYTDQTGNLRSSTGYLIVVDGNIIDRNFSTANKDEDSKGVATGQTFAENLANKYNKGHVLIVVAGMSYAAAVESKSKDVLTSAEKYAEKQLPKLLRRLKKSIENKKV